MSVAPINVLGGVLISGPVDYLYVYIYSWECYGEHRQVIIEVSTLESVQWTPLLKDTLNKGHNTFNLSIKDNSVVPTGPWQYNFTS